MLQGDGRLGDGRPGGGVPEAAETDGHVLADGLPLYGAGKPGPGGLVDDVERVILCLAHGAIVQDAGEADDAAILVEYAVDQAVRL